MNQDSIFDEEDLVPEKVHWIYRVVGVLRLILVIFFIYITSFIAYELKSNLDITTVFLVLIFTLISILNLRYLIPQTREELVLSNNVYSKKICSTVPLVSTIVIFIFIIYSFIIDWDLIQIRSIILASFILLFLLLILIIDFRYIKLRVNSNKYLKR